MNANDRAIAGFTMSAHGLVHWFETAIPILLVVWLAEFDVSVALVGVVVAIGYAPFGLGALPAGILADRYGPRPLVLLCISGMSMAFLVIALAGTIWSIGLGIVLWGIAASMYHPAGLSLISTGVTGRGTVFAWHGIAGNLGIALGPLTTAVLLIRLDWSTVAALLALPGIVTVIVGARASFDTFAGTAVDSAANSDAGTSGRTFLAESRTLFASAFALVFAIVTFEGLFYRGVLTYLPEIMQDVPTLSGVGAGIGLDGIEPTDFIFVGLLIVGMAGQYAGGKATERIPAGVGLAGIFLVLAALALAFVPIATLGVAPLIAWAATVGIFLFGIQPFYQEAVAIYTPPEGRGLSYGFTYLGEFGLGATSVAIGGFLLDAYTVSVFFVFLAACAIVGGGLATVLVGRDMRQSDS